MNSFRPKYAAVLFAAVTLALPLAAMTNKDLIKMKAAELSEDTILRAMQGQKPEYDVSADGLIELKKAGLSEAIIAKAMDAMDTPPPSSAGTPASDSPSQESPSPVPAPGGVDFFEMESPSIAPPFVTPEIGKIYFTRFTLHYERGTWRSTNYARGVIVPINTPVRLLSMEKDRMLLLRTDTNEELKVENEEKFTRKSVGSFAQLMLSAEKTPLERLPTALASAIKNGEMRRGMTKEQVLMARGYPPAHETPSTDLDRWVYWSSRFVKQTIVFANGRLVEGRGTY